MPRLFQIEKVGPNLIVPRPSDVSFKVASGNRSKIGRLKTGRGAGSKDENSMIRERIEDGGANPGIENEPPKNQKQTDENKHAAKQHHEHGSVPQPQRGGFPENGETAPYQAERDEKAVSPRQHEALPRPTSPDDVLAAQKPPRERVDARHHSIIHEPLPAL